MQKLKNKNWIFIILVLILLLKIFFVPKYRNYRIKKGVLEDIQINTFKLPILEIKSSSGFGDNELLVSFDCSKNKDDIIRQIENYEWNKIPMPNAIRLKLYGESITVNNITYHSNRKIPNIENGYWFFLDRDINNKENYSVIYSYVRHYSVGVYDSDKQILYYYEENT